MSTYTDLQNKIKETVNVDYKTRITNLPVKFLHEQNEYWGTFRGTVAVDDATIVGGTIKNATIYDSALCGKITLPGGVDLGKIGTEVSTISTNLDLAFSDITSLHNLLTSETELRIAADSELESKILESSGGVYDKLVEVSSELDRKIDVVSVHLDGKIGVETEGRIAADTVLESKISENTRLILTETEIREGADDVLQSNINSLDSKTAEVDNALCTRIKKHETDTTIALADEHSKMLSTVSYDKHYTFYGLNNEILDCYPYQLKDFSVNVLKTSINEGIVKSSKNIDIGRYNVTDDGKTIIDINFPLLDDDLTKAVNPGSKFVFTSGCKSLCTGVPSVNPYTITLDDTVEPIELNLRQITDAFYELWYNGNNIGAIRDFEPSTAGSPLLSGKISITPTGIPELEPFVCSNLPFSRENYLIKIPGTTEEIEFNRDDYKSFKLRKGVKTVKYCSISSIDDSPVEFGEILSGNVISSNETITNIKFKLLSPFESEDLIELNTANSFTNIVKSDYILSSQISGLLAKFELVNRHAYFKYDVHLSDDTEFISARVATITVGKINTELSTKDFDYLSVSLEDLLIAEKFKNQTYTLTKTVTGGITTWKCVKHFEEAALHPSWIILEYIGNDLFVDTWNSDNGTGGQRHFIVDNSHYSYANSDALTTVYKSNFIDVFKYDLERTSATYIYPVTDVRYHGSESPNPFTLTVDTSKGGKLDFSIPSKSWSEISREFILVLNIISSETSLSAYKCDFGSDIRIFNDKSSDLWIKPGIWSTYQFNEIKQNTFLVTDLNNNREYTELYELSSKVLSEIDLRNSLYAQLSDAISANIDRIEELVLLSDDLCSEISANSRHITEISTDIYKNVDSGSLNERGLSGKVEFLLSSDKSSMCYGGTLRTIVPTSTPFKLKDFLSANFHRADGFLKKGFTFRLSSTLVFYPEVGTETSSYIFFENDYFIVNKDVVVSDITSSDVDVIFDASHESYNLSSDLSNLRLSVDQISSKIDSLCTDISTAIIDDRKNISEISGHYDKTFEKDYLFDIIGSKISVDLLKLSDELENGKGYTLHLSGGTLVLIPVTK